MSSIELVSKDIQKINKKTEKVRNNIDCSKYKEENVAKLEKQKFSCFNKFEKKAHEYDIELKECEKRLEKLERQIKY